MEKKTWVKPELEDLGLNLTEGGGITDIIENGFYHT